jgi:hypothetical protein
MAEGGDLHHESRAKWPISADDYELEEVIGKIELKIKTFFYFYLKFHIKVEVLQLLFKLQQSKKPKNVLQSNELILIDAIHLLKNF